MVADLALMPLIIVRLILSSLIIEVILRSLITVMQYRRSLKLVVTKRWPVAKY